MLLFWRAFVLPRPFGAAPGGTLTKPIPQGGFGFGTVGSSAILITFLAGLITYLGGRYAGSCA